MLPVRARRRRESGDDSNTRDMADEHRIEDDEILTVGQVSNFLKLHQRTILQACPEMV